MPNWFDVCLPLVARWEGCARVNKADGLVYPYLDKLAKPNVWTRGYGRTYGITGESSPITQDEAKQELGFGLRNYCYEVLLLAPALSERPNALAAVTSWAWNCGVGAFKRSRMRRAINEGRWEDAAQRILTPRTAGGVEFKGLALRRNAEAEIFRKDV